MMDILLGMALLIPPPRPPPPPERLAAAAELRRLAPFSARFREYALDRGIWRAARDALRGSAGEPRHAELVGEAMNRIAVRLAGSGADIEARADRCLDEGLGHGFDLATLQEMARILPTKGGQVLWEQAMREPAHACYEESVRNLLVGFTSAISWLASKGLLGRLPRHDPSLGIPPTLTNEIETLCGRRARGAFQVRNGSLGVPSEWVDRETKRIRGRDDTFFCLLTAAKVSGFEPVIFRP